MKHKKTIITERVRKNPDEEKTRLQFRLRRAKTLGQQTRVADALSAARAAAGEKKPSDKRSWGASTGTARQLKSTTKQIGEGASASKTKRSHSPTLGTFRAGMDTENPTFTTSARSLKRRKTDAEGRLRSRSSSTWWKTKQASALDALVNNNIKNSEKLMQIINIKPEGTVFEIYGMKNGKEQIIKVKKIRSEGNLVFIMTGNRQVEIHASGAGLQVLDKKSQRQIISNGNDMIWESADHSDVGRRFII